MLDNLTLEKHLKSFQRNITVLGLSIGIVTSIGVCYGFYYNTNSKLDTHSEKIESIELNLGEMATDIKNSSIYQGASKEQIKALENQVTDVKKGQDRIEDKLDKLIMKTYAIKEK